MTIIEMVNKYREVLKSEGIYTDKVVELMVDAYRKGCLDYQGLLLIPNEDLI